MAAIVQSIGLELSDLFPPDADQTYPEKREGFMHQRPRLLPPSQALELIAHEVVIVVLAASDLHKGRRLSQQYRARLIHAAARIQALVSEARP